MLCATVNKAVMPAGVAGLTPTATVAPVTAAASPTNMNLCKVGNQTSSVDPQAVNARVFVVNLNTFQVTKTDVEKVFQRYGRIAGNYVQLILYRKEDEKSLEKVSSFS